MSLLFANVASHTCMISLLQSVSTYKNEKRFMTMVWFYDFTYKARIIRSLFHTESTKLEFRPYWRSPVPHIHTHTGFEPRSFPAGRCAFYHCTINSHLGHSEVSIWVFFGCCLQWKPALHEGRWGGLDDLKFVRERWNPEGSQPSVENVHLTHYI